MMKLMTMKQYMKMSKPALIRKITKTLRVMPKAKLARLCYNITKSKLPRLSTSRQIMNRPKYYKFGSGKPLPRNYETLSMTTGRLTYKKKPKKKRKFSKKQLAAQRLFAKRARAGTLKRRRR